MSPPTFGATPSRHVAASVRGRTRIQSRVVARTGADTVAVTPARADPARIDNVDLRFATHLVLGSRDLLAGITLHNNPTVQDVWNTVPAWGYPYTNSSITPSPTSVAASAHLSPRVRQRPA